MTDRTEQMIHLLDYAEEVLTTRYAPAAFKKKRFGWTAAAAFEEARDEVRSKRMSDAEFRNLVRRLFRSPHDIHTSAYAAKATAVWLGVHFRTTADGVVIAWVDRTVLSKDTFPFEVGDRLVKFDGLEPDTALARTVEATQWRSTPQFERRFAEWFLTYRASSEWDSVPTPGETVGVAIDRAGDVRQVTLTWLDDDANPPSERCPHWGKTKQGFLPPLGPVTWRGAGKHFVAYVLDDAGERFGYIRIPSYKYGRDERLAALAEFEAAVDQFVSCGVSGLIIDQTGNGGGNYLFGFALLSRLTDRPMAVPLQRYLITADKQIVGWMAQDELRAMAAPFAAVKTATAATQLLTTHPVFAGPLNFVPKTLAAAKTFDGFATMLASQPAPSEGVTLTAPLYQFQPTIEPIATAAGHRYTGPIVLLIDALNISAAEYVAATLADNDRATLVGVTTAGAGGDQRDLAPDRVCGDAREDPFAPCVPAQIAAIMKQFGIGSMSYTITLGERVHPDGRVIGPIENTGVAPHGPLPITRADLTTGYAEYRAEVLRALRAVGANSAAHRQPKLRPGTP